MTHNPPQLDAATAMMLAADYIEQEGRFDFQEIHIPRSCLDKGCVLGWIGYVLGLDCITKAARRIGYVETRDYSAREMFYLDMDRACGNFDWLDNANTAATGLRKLARERME